MLLNSVEYLYMISYFKNRKAQNIKKTQRLYILHYFFFVSSVGYLQSPYLY